MTRTKSTRKPAVGTVKKSRETRSRTWLARNVRQAWDGGVCRMLGLESLAGPEPALSDGMEHVSAKRVRTPTSGRESRVRDQTDRLQKPEGVASTS